MEPVVPGASTQRRPRTALWLAAVVFLSALLVYSGSALLVGHTRAAHSSYFEHLAAAFLNGRLDLAAPPGQSDLTLHDGRWYVPFPPLAAVLLLPWVALFGVAGTNTVAFSIVWGAANVALLALILDGLTRRGWIALHLADRCWLVVLFGLGCVHWYVALEGSVWYLSHVCTVLLTALAVWAAVANRSPWLVGLALAAALWARPNVILTWPLLLGIFAQHLRPHGQWEAAPQPGADVARCRARAAAARRALLGWAWRSAVPLALSLAGLLAYNYARFDDPLDFGYRRQNVSAELRGALARGQFHPCHIPRNLHTLLLGVPRWYEPERLPIPRLLAPDAHGMSILLTSPALFYLVRARQRRDPLVRGAWLATGLLLIPILLYYNTGWRQFGYRFSLDFMLPVMILLAVAAGRRVSWPLRGLIVAGVLINAWGVVWWFTNWLD